MLHRVRLRGRRNRVALAIAVAVIAGGVTLPASAYAAATTTTTPTAGVRMAALAPRVPLGATDLGAVPATSDVTITVALHPTHADQLDALLSDLYDPSSPRYGQWLTTGEFDSRFGPDPAQVAQVTAWLTSKGLTTAPAQGEKRVLRRGTSIQGSSAMC